MSPIIATILLVAVTVVLAALLYVLVTQDISGSAGKAPIYVGFGKAEASTGAPPTAYDDLELSVSTGVTTHQFGVTLSNPSGVGVAVATTTACGATYWTCTAPVIAGSWYGLLVNSQGTVLDSFTSSGWSSTVTVQGTDLILVSNGPYAGTGDVVGVFGTSGSAVSGSTSL
ncbi:MAG: archaellin/type IV pilin N-terminal domain-containing protein [Thermoplasmata archaeon]